MLRINGSRHLCKQWLVARTSEPAVDEQVIDFQVKLKPVGAFPDTECLHVTCIGARKMRSAVRQLDRILMLLKYLLPGIEGGKHRVVCARFGEMHVVPADFPGMIGLDDRSKGARQQLRAQAYSEYGHAPVEGLL